MFAKLGSCQLGESGHQSMYFYEGLQLLLVINFADLKLSGPEQNLPKGWEFLRSKLRLEPETGSGSYLGCLL